MRSAAKRSESTSSAGNRSAAAAISSRSIAKSIEGHAVDAVCPIAQGSIAAITDIGQNLGHRFGGSEIAPEDAAQTLLQRIGQRRFRLAAIEDGALAS